MLETNTEAHDLDGDDDPHSKGLVWGICYQISAEHIESVLEYLDVRERGGYTRVQVDVYEFEDSTAPMLSNVLLYSATRDNPNYLGPSSLNDIATQIALSVGPSCRNDEYLFKLAETLRSHNVHDDHVFEIEELVMSLSIQKRLSN